MLRTKRKAISVVEYALLFMMAAVMVWAMMSAFESQSFRTLFKYTFLYKEETPNAEGLDELKIGPMTD